MKTYTHIAVDEDVAHQDGFTITTVWRAKWWKRPWYWLRRIPTSEVMQYERCNLTHLSFNISADEAAPVIGLAFRGHKQ